MDPKAPGDPETDPVMLLVTPSGITPTTFGIGQLMRIVTSVECRRRNRCVQGGEEGYNFWSEPVAEGQGKYLRRLLRYLGQRR